MISLSDTWGLLKTTVFSFIEDEALSRGAAIAFYTVTSIAPVLLIVIAIAGLAFGRDAAQNALTAQLSGLMGQQTAEVLQSAVASAAGKSSGIIATIVGILTLFVTASGVFGEMQSALNAIWKAKPKRTTVSRLIRARIASLGLVASLGFLLIVSLVVSAALSAFGNFLNSIWPFGKVLLIRPELCRFASAHLNSLRSYLQSLARSSASVARCRRGRSHYGNLIHHRQVAHWMVYRQQRCGFQLRRCRRAYRPPPVGLLFGSDFLAGRGVHQSLCEPLWEQEGNAGRMLPRSG
jgi:hypothetical protein